MIMSLLLHWTGGDNGSSPQYLELSGFLSIIIPPLLTVLGLAFTYWLHTRCHVAGCLHHGKHEFQHYKLCRRHHPCVPQGGITHLHILQLHKRSKK